MRPCLADVNVALAICHAGHQHYAEAREFAAQLAEESLKICRVVQLGLLRLLGNRHVMHGYPMTVDGAWNILSAFMQAERSGYIDEPPGLLERMSTYRRFPGAGPNFWTDAYLAAFAAQAGLPVVTFDRGFRKFGIPVHVLGESRN